MARRRGSVAGNIGCQVLERTEGGITHFVTMTFRENMETIVGFAGNDPEIARYHPEDEDFLLEFEPTVIHGEVASHSWPATLCHLGFQAMSRPQK